MITCTFEDGGEGKLRHVIVDALIIKDEKILLAKRSPKLFKEGGKWDLIGGFMDRDEDLEEALRREVLEEVGYKLKEIKLFTVINRPDREGSDWQNVAFFYVCAPAEKVGEMDWESTEVKWFDLNKIPSKEELAFDHYEIINLYLKNRNFTPIKLLNY